MADSIWLKIFVFSLFFFATWLWIMRKDIVFSLYYLVLFIYTIFTQLAYQLFPEEMDQQQHYGETIFNEYWTFVFLSFACIAGWYWLLTRSKTTNKPVRTSDTPTAKHSHARLLHVAIFILLWNLALGYLTTTRLADISYQEQTTLKSDMFFRNLYFATPIVIIFIYAVMAHVSIPAVRLAYFGLFLLTLSIFVYVAMRSGSRSPPAVTCLGLITFYYLKKHQPHKFFRMLATISVIGIVCFIGLLFLQIARRETVDLARLMDLLGTPGELFNDPVYSLKGILLQDYYGPSLLLMTSMCHNITLGAKGFMILLMNTLPMNSTPSLGKFIADMMNSGLQPWEGFGYYVLCEGYNLLGWWGWFYNGTVFVLGYMVCKHIFVDRRNKGLRRFMMAVLAMQVLNVVRGESSEYIRAAYMALLPACILYSYAMNLRFVRRRETHVRANILISGSPRVQPNSETMAGMKK